MWWAILGGAERISVVAYFRERMTGCGSLAEEAAKAEAIAEKRNQFASKLTEADLYGPSGTSPKPTALRLLHAEKPYRINQSEPQPAEALPEPAQSLSEAGRAI